MAAYKLGASGPEVQSIQRALQTRGLYRGPLDGAFGGGTEAAVKAFQRANDLAVDGVVGEQTWRKLLAGAPATFRPPPILAEPLEKRCLALTGTFETGSGPPECFAALNGDFDGQGISFGVCQWNFGQGSLQRLLLRAIQLHPAIVRAIFQERYDVLAAALAAPREDLMAFARSIQNPRNGIHEPWRGMFKAMARTPEFQDVEVEAARSLLDAARTWCTAYGVTSQRALALMFDVKVQNGSIGEAVRARILGDFSRLPASLARDEAELAKLRIIAHRRADAADPRWAEDVRERKLCIANGGGRVHGILYDLAEDFGIGLDPCAPSTP